MLRRWVSLLACLFLTGCITLEAGYETIPTPDLQLTGTIIVLETENARLDTMIATLRVPKPTLTPTLAPTSILPSPSVTPPQPPRFSSLRFSTKPGEAPWQHFFVAGTPQIFAVWDYSNIKDGMLVKRVWERNGEVWLERELGWDFEKYGANGTINDVSIFEFDQGIGEGKYDLSLYIDGALQKVESPSPGAGGSLDKATFWVLPPQVSGPLPSPDGTKVAWVRRGGSLVLQTPSDEQKELVTIPEISSLDWFPDNRHIVYSVRDRSQQVNESEDWGITHELWIIDSDTGQRYRIGTKEENLNSPRVSPNGRYIAVLSGVLIGNTCFSDPRLAILPVDSAFQRQGLIRIIDFSGLPFSNAANYGIHPADPKNPISWVNETEFSANLVWSCVGTGNPPNGEYLFDLNSMQAKWVGLP